MPAKTVRRELPLMDISQAEETVVITPVTALAVPNSGTTDKILIILFKFLVKMERRKFI